MDQIAEFCFGEKIEAQDRRFAFSGINIPESKEDVLANWLGGVFGLFGLGHHEDVYESMKRKYNGRPVKEWYVDKFLYERSGGLKSATFRRVGYSSAYIVPDSTVKFWFPKGAGETAKPIFSEYFFCGAEYGAKTKKLVRVWFAGIPPIDFFCKKNAKKKVAEKTRKADFLGSIERYQRDAITYLKKQYNIPTKLNFSPKNPTGVYFEVDSSGVKKRRIEFWQRSFTMSSLVVITDLEIEAGESALSVEKKSPWGVKIKRKKSEE